MKNKLYIFCGKAGSGKDTVVKELCKVMPDKFFRVVGHTTRPPREGEINGVDYYFEKDSTPILEDCVEKDVFNNWKYYTLKSDFSSKKINLKIMTPRGIIKLLNSDIKDEFDITIFYIAAKDKIRLLRQLNREENPNVQEIVRRFAADTHDFAITPFDCVLLNNNTKEELDYIVKLISLGSFN